MRPALSALLVQLGRKDLLEQPELSVRRDLLVHKDQRVTSALLARLERSGLPDPLDRSGRRELKVQQGIQELRD